MHVRLCSARTCAVLIAACLVTSDEQASAQTADAQALRQEIEQLRKELQAIQQQYGDRLTVLETKLGAAQGAAAAVAPVAAQSDLGPTAQVPPGSGGAGGPA